MKFNYTFLFLFLLGCAQTTSPVKNDHYYNKKSKTHLKQNESEKGDKKEVTALLSAASGLVQIENNYFIISDDSDLLYNCTYELKSCVTFTPPFHQDMPDDPNERKNIKPDFESLIQWPSDQPNEIQLLAIPSGSKKYRHNGGLFVLEKLNDQFVLNHNKTKIVNFDKLYKKLDDKIKKLNIEGAAIIPGAPSILRLFHRGNSKNGIPATIDLDFENVHAAIKNNISITKKSFLSIKSYDLDQFGFTDVHSFIFNKKNYIAFLLAREVTDDPANDGKILGSKYGIMDINGQILQTELWPKIVKAEGLVVRVNTNNKKNNIKFIAVTDADDPATPAEWVESEIYFNMYSY